MKIQAMQRLADLGVREMGAETAERFVGTKEWFLGLDPAKQKDYMTRNPTSTFKAPHAEQRVKKAIVKKIKRTKAVNKSTRSLAPKTGFHNS